MSAAGRIIAFASSWTVSTSGISMLSRCTGGIAGAASNEPRLRWRAFSSSSSFSRSFFELSNPRWPGRPPGRPPPPPPPELGAGPWAPGAPGTGAEPGGRGVKGRGPGGVSGRNGPFDIGRRPAGGPPGAPGGCVPGAPAGPGRWPVVLGRQTGSGTRSDPRPPRNAVGRTRPSRVRMNGRLRRRGTRRYDRRASGRHRSQRRDVAGFDRGLGRARAQRQRSSGRSAVRPGGRRALRGSRRGCGTRRGTRRLGPSGLHRRTNGRSRGAGRSSSRACRGSRRRRGLTRDGWNGFERRNSRSRSSGGLRGCRRRRGCSLRSNAPGGGRRGRGGRRRFRRGSRFGSGNRRSRRRSGCGDRGRGQRRFGAGTAGAGTAAADGAAVPEAGQRMPEAGQRMPEAGSGCRRLRGRPEAGQRCRRLRGRCRRMREDAGGSQRMPGLRGGCRLCGRCQRLRGSGCRRLRGSDRRHLGSRSPLTACTLAAAALPSWARSRSATFGSTTLSWFFASRPRRPKSAMRSFDDMLSSFASSKILTLPVAIDVLYRNSAVASSPPSLLTSFAFPVAATEPTSPAPVPSHHCTRASLLNPGNRLFFTTAGRTWASRGRLRVRPHAAGRRPPSLPSAGRTAAVPSARALPAPDAHARGPR